MHFFMPMNPPTATAQEKQSTINKNGKRCYYKNERLQKAEDQLIDGLSKWVPKEKLCGPIYLDVMWLYPAGKSHEHGEWRTSKPDTDNMQKLLKDCMTRLGYWVDDAYVVWQVCRKMWTKDMPGIFISVGALMGNNSGLQRVGDDG